MVTQIHQFRNGSIVFRTDCNTGELFYNIAFLLYGGQIIPALGEKKVENEEHLEALLKSKNLADILQIERKFDIVRENMPDGF